MSVSCVHSSQKNRKGEGREQRAVYIKSTPGWVKEGVYTFYDVSILLKHDRDFPRRVQRRVIRKLRNLKMS